MSRNYGLGSRDMWRAVASLLNAYARRQEISFKTSADLKQRWRLFYHWAITHGVHRLELVTREVAIAYGLELAAAAEADDLSVATAHNYLSALNRVMELVRGDRAVFASAIHDCGIPPRDGVCRVTKATPLSEHKAAIILVPPVIAALLELQRSLGLRFKESALFNPKLALRDAEVKQSVSIKAGTKGGKERCVPVNDAALHALDFAAAIQEGTRSMIADGLTFVEFMGQAYRSIAKTVVNFHGERHAYAHQRYRELMGVCCPVEAGVGHGWPHYRYLAEALKIEVETARERDRKVREIVAKELGHHRVGITNAYYG